MINNKKILLLIILSLITINIFANELFIESQSSGIAKMNIAILPFIKLEGSQNLKELPADVIISDFNFSDRFNIVFMKEPDTAIMHKKQIDLYIIGKYMVKGSKISLDCRLYDSWTIDQILGKKFNTKLKHMRRAIHLFSDEVVFSLYGEKGIASSRIVCTHKIGRGKKEILLLDYDGHRPHYITQNRVLNMCPSFSPSNNSIIYTSWRKGRPYIYTTNIYSGKTDILLKKGSLNISPDWNVAEDRIVFCSNMDGNSELYTINADGSDLLRLTIRSTIEATPSWSPNGYEIAYTSDRSGSPHIYIMDNEGASMRKLTTKGRYNSDPAWSPNGDKIAYVSLENGNFNIFTISIDGSTRNQLTSSSGNNEGPSWSPDGRHLVFTSNRFGKYDLFIMNEKGENQKKITHTGNVTAPEWSDY